MTESPKERAMRIKTEREAAAAKAVVTPDIVTSVVKHEKTEAEKEREREEKERKRREREERDAAAARESEARTEARLTAMIDARIVAVLSTEDLEERIVVKLREMALAGDAVAALILNATAASLRRGDVTTPRWGWIKTLKKATLAALKEGL